MLDRVLIATISFGMGWSLSNLSKQYQFPIPTHNIKPKITITDNIEINHTNTKPINIKQTHIKTDSISLLLENGNFYDALSLYLDSHNPNQYLYKMENYLKQLSKKDIQKAILEIELFRENEPTNNLFDTLIDCYIQTDNFKKAIDTIKLKRDDYIDEDRDKILINRLKDVVLAYEKYLYRVKSFKELILLFKNMIEYAPDEYYETKLDKYKNLKSFDYIIPLKKYNNHFTIQVLLDDIEFNLMIDTGASYIFIDRDRSYFFDTIRDDLILDTANGKIEASLQKVNSLKIGELELKDINITSSEFKQNGIDGLLGMNFFKLFDFKIDQENSILYLKSR